MVFDNKPITTAIAIAREANYIASTEPSKAKHYLKTCALWLMITDSEITTFSQAIRILKYNLWWFSMTKAINPSEAKTLRRVFKLGI